MQAGVSLLAYASLAWRCAVLRCAVLRCAVLCKLMCGCNCLQVLFTC